MNEYQIAHKYCYINAYEMPTKWITLHYHRKDYKFLTGFSIDNGDLDTSVSFMVIEIVFTTHFSLFFINITPFS